MAARYHETDYLYISARIRAMESSLVGREKLNSLAELKSTAEITAALSSLGFTPVLREDGSEDVEEMLEAALRNGFATVSAVCPEPQGLAFLQYPYDCNNIKVILKCAVRGISPDGMFTDIGTVPVARLKVCMAEQRYAELPPHMAAAIPAACEAYAKTKNPQEFDLLLDCACFADMKESTKGFPFAQSAVAHRADLVNLMTCLRLLRMGATYPMRATLFRALVPGGTLGEQFFAEAFDGGESRFVDLVAMTPYAPILDVAGERTLAAVEKAADDLYFEFVKTAKSVPFGAEVPIGYLAGLEASVKNLRILLAGKAAGLPADTIRGRLRSSYV